MTESTTLAVPDSFLPDLDSSVREVLFMEGEPIKFTFGTVFLEQGDLESDFYVLLEGKVRVLAPSVDGRERTLAILDAGAYFGEMSLLHDQEVSATVRAKSDGIVIRIPGARFLACCEEHDEIAGMLQEGVRKRTLCNFFAHSTAFDSLSTSAQEDLIGALKEVSFTEGAYIIREGDPPGPLYVLHHGRVKVVQERQGRQQVLAYLRAGDFFGERALVTKENRAASVICVSPVDALSLDQEAFHELCEKEAEFSSLITRKVPEYSEDELPVPPLDFSMLDREPDEDLLFLQHGGHEIAADTYFVDPAYPFVQQLYDHDCGIACLLGLLRWYGKPASRKELLRMSHFPTEGSTPAALMVLASDCGISLEHRTLHDVELERVHLPALFHTQDEHWLLVYEQRNESWTVSDPARGLANMNTDQLSGQWSGHVLECHTEKEEHSTFPSFHLRLISLCVPKDAVPTLSMYIGILAGLYVAVPATLLWLLPHIALSPVGDRLTASSLFLVVGFMFLGSKSYLQVQLQRLAGDVSMDQGSRWFAALVRDASGDLFTFTAHDMKSRIEAITRYRTELLVPCYRLLLSAVTLCLGLLAFMIVVPSMIPGVFICVAGALLLFVLRRQEGVMVSSDELRRQFIDEVHDELRQPSELFRFVALPALYQRWNAAHQYIERAAGVQAQSQVPFIVFTEALLLYLTLLWLVSGVMAELSLQQLSGLSGLVLIIGYSLYRLLRDYSLLAQRRALLERLDDVHYVSEVLTAQQRRHTVRSVQGSLEAKDFSLLAESGEPLHSPCTLELKPGTHYHFFIEHAELLRHLGRFISGESLSYRGHFMVDYVERRDIETGGYRSFIGTLTEDMSLLSGSLWENIACYREVEPGLIRRLMKELGVEAKIQQLPSGYDTLSSHACVQEDMEIRRCVSLVRLICQRPAIIVCRGREVLSLDDRAFLEKHIPHKFTLISIARELLSYTEDVTFVMFKELHVVEIGTHRELMKKENLYYQRRTVS